MYDVLNIRDNIRLLSVVTILVLYFWFEDIQIAIFLLSWIVIMLVMGNVRRLPPGKYFLDFTRMTLYFLPLAIPAFIFLEVNLAISVKVIPYILIAFLFFFIWFLFNYKKIKFSLSNQIIALSPKTSKFTLGMNIYNLIGAAFSEEIFFRLFLLSLPLPNIILFFLSCSYFILFHYTLPWGNSFKKEDFVNQFVLGALCALLFLFSGSIIPSIFLHILINSIYICRDIRCFDRHHIRRNYYDSLISSEETLNDLDI